MLTKILPFGSICMEWLLQELFLRGGIIEGNANTYIDKNKQKWYNIHMQVTREPRPCTHMRFPTH